MSGEAREEPEGLGDEGDQHPLSGSYRATLVCAWAEEGADALGPDGQLLHSDAFPPPRVVDTLGAGDTFNASVIFSLSKGESLSLGSGQGWVRPSLNARLTLPLVSSRKQHAGGPEIRLPSGWQEVRSAGL